MQAFLNEFDMQPPISSRVPDHTVSGDGDITVYLLHGIYGAKEYWRDMTARLVARGFRVVAWDAPGYGLSPLPETFSFDTVADAGAALIRATGTKTNIVFGQSMGGQISPRIRLKAPEHVHGLVITSTIGFFGNRTPEEQEEFVRKRTMSPDTHDASAQNRAMVDSMKAHGTHGAEFDFVKEVAARTAAATVTAAVAAVRSYPTDEAVATVRAVDVPALVVAGALDDTAPPATMKRFAEMMPRSTFRVIADSAHYPWVENPKEFDLVLFEFLEREFGTSRGRA